MAPTDHIGRKDFLPEKQLGEELKEPVAIVVAQFLLSLFQAQTLARWYRNFPINENSKPTSDIIDQRKSGHYGPRIFGFRISLLY